MHSTSHKLAATGNAGQSNHHISACIVAKAETAFETFQKDNPKLNWDPKTIRVRMTHMAHNLPPIIARAFTTSQLQRASANVGYEVFDKKLLRLDDAAAVPCPTQCLQSDAGCHRAVPQAGHRGGAG